MAARRALKGLAGFLDMKYHTCYPPIPDPQGQVSKFQCFTLLRVVAVLESFGTLKGKLTFRMVPHALLGLTLWVIQISRLRLRSPAQCYQPYPSSHALQLTYAYVMSNICCL